MRCRLRAAHRWLSIGGSAMVEATLVARIYSRIFEAILGRRNIQEFRLAWIIDFVAAFRTFHTARLPNEAKSPTETISSGHHIGVSGSLARSPRPPGGGPTCRASRAARRKGTLARAGREGADRGARARGPLGAWQGAGGRALGGILAAAAQSAWAGSRRP